MSIKLELPKITELKPRITVIGVGGAGCNAINNMIATGLDGVEYVVANTDAQSLAMSSAENRIQLGANLTEGLGAGANPDIGQAAAEEALDEIRAQIEGSHMVFLAAGLGGGTGTGAVSVIARAAQEMGILTVGIVTLPFQFEGSRRMRVAMAGLSELEAAVDTMIAIPNQNLFRVTTEKTSFAEAFVLADQVLYSGIACIVDLIVKDGLINLDFADVRAVMKGMGAAMMGTGEASGERRAVLAAEQAVSNPLLDDVSLAGAKGLLVSIIGGSSMTLYDVDAAASRVKDEADPDANIIVGASFDDTLEDRIRVSIVASGMNSERVRAPVSGGGTAGGWGGVVDPEPRQTTASAGDTSEPVAAAQSPDPYLGHETPNDFARVLSNLIGRAEPPPPPQAPSIADEQPIPAWQSPDGVVIEDTSPVLPQRGAPPPLPADRDGYASHGEQHGIQHGDQHGDQRGGAQEGFIASAPAHVERDVQAIPDIAAFPEVAQREYHARQAGQPQSPDAHAGGLLQRLGIGMRRGANHLQDSDPDHGRKNVHEADNQRSGEASSRASRGASTMTDPRRSTESNEMSQPTEEDDYFSRRIRR